MHQHGVWQCREMVSYINFVYDTSTAHSDVTKVVGVSAVLTFLLDHEIIVVDHLVN